MRGSTYYLCRAVLGFSSRFMPFWCQRPPLSFGLKSENVVTKAIWDLSFKCKLSLRRVSMEQKISEVEVIVSGTVNEII